jgi:hypothetical protein
MRTSNLIDIAPESLSKFLILCHKGAETLETVIRELDAEVKKRRLFGGLKVVLKLGTINKLKERVRSAQLMLLLSHQICSE